MDSFLKIIALLCSDKPVKPIVFLVVVLLLGIVVGSQASKYVSSPGKIEKMDIRISDLESSDKTDKIVLINIYQSLDRIEKNLERTREEVSLLKTSLITHK